MGNRLFGLNEMETKYVMFGGFLPVVFPAMLPVTHAEMARLLSPHIGEPPTSAGFVGADAAGNINAYGESFSLGLKSDPKDSPILQRLITG